MPPRISPDEVADCVLKAFDALPAKFKPRGVPSGRREWVPLVGLVLSKDLGPTSSIPRLTCAALATGMKCLPQGKLTSAKGNVLHDWHAEILAVRAFNRWLVDECAELAVHDGAKSEGAWVRWKAHGNELNKGAERDPSDHALPPFELQDGVGIHMYCSEAPCGDASMELTMAAQDDATAWTNPIPDGGEALLGRGHFDRLGIVRRKPARPDAPMTGSKSCSDKLAMKQCTSLLGGLASLLVHPRAVYLDTLVLPETQCVPEAVQRAFGEQGRMKGMVDGQRSWEGEGGGYAFKPFRVTTTRREFAFSRRASAAGDVVPSNLSALFTPTRKEVLINGVLQGRKQLDVRGASCVSRRLLWQSVLDVAAAVSMPELMSELRQRTYGEIKSHKALHAREVVKQDVKRIALREWTKNRGDESWGLEDEQ